MGISEIAKGGAWVHFRIIQSQMYGFILEILLCNLPTKCVCVRYLYQLYPLPFKVFLICHPLKLLYKVLKHRSDLSWVLVTL